MTVPDYRIQQALAWEEVWDTLVETSPGFASEPLSGRECAVKAIKILGEKARAYDHLMALIEASKAPKA